MPPEPASPASFSRLLQGVARALTTGFKLTWCVKLGFANAKAFAGASKGRPCFWRVQTPWGPLHRGKVAIKFKKASASGAQTGPCQASRASRHLKSGMPQLVEMPAPVNTTTLFASLICSQNELVSGPQQLQLHRKAS